MNKMSNRSIKKNNYRKYKQASHCGCLHCQMDIKGIKLVGGYIQVAEYNPEDDKDENGWF